MSEWLSSFVVTFVPIFIALDAVGNVPFVISLSEGMSAAERRTTVHVACLGATALGLAFLLFGRIILAVLGISVGSFAIAGGIVLLVLSINYLIGERHAEVGRLDTVAIVPIGTPLLVGPATITTLLLLSTQHGMPMVLLSFALNMVLTWGVFLLSTRFQTLLGVGGLKAVGKVFELLLAAIAVNMIIRGLDMTGIVSVAG